jgi:hypothetical protein
LAAAPAAGTPASVPAESATPPGETAAVEQPAGTAPAAEPAPADDPTAAMLADGRKKLEEIDQLLKDSEQ